MDGSWLRLCALLGNLMFACSISRSCSISSTPWEKKMLYIFFVLLRSCSALLWAHHCEKISKKQIQQNIRLHISLTTHSHATKNHVAEDCSDFHLCVSVLVTQNDDMFWWALMARGDAFLRVLLFIPKP